MNHEEHCQHSFKTTGVRGDDIHSYIDRCPYMGKNHRIVGHTPEDLVQLLEHFKGKYPEQIIRDIFYDHLILDGMI